MQAILITAYKNINHLKDIISFFDDRFSFYIHFDKKSNIKKDDLTDLYQYKNVVFISEKYTINWGGINHLKAILELAKEALKNNENSFFHLITGHDFPIKSSTSFIEFERLYADKIFMEYHPLPYKEWDGGGFDRILQYNFYDLMDGRTGIRERLLKNSIKLQKKLHIKRPLYTDFPKLYGGSTYWSMSREAMEYVFNYLDQNPQFLKRFKYTFCSEEFFFQTILLNSPLNEKIINDNKRFIVWEKRNGNYPANLDLTDLENIKKTNALFARKFEYPVSSDLLAKIKRNEL